MIKIVAGKYRSRLIEVPPTVTVPTKNRVREAIFSALGERLIGARVLDLFAGSGALAFEALSRGAREADLVDCSKEAVSVIEKNKKALKEANARVHLSDAMSFLRLVKEPYDIVFLDPPYKDEQAYADSVAYLVAHSLTSKGGSLVVESEKEEFLPSLEGFEERTYNYGRTFVRILRRD